MVVGTVLSQSYTNPVATIRTEVLASLHGRRDGLIALSQ